jgi:hypothetical protein
MPSAGWENLSDEGGVLGLLPIDSPGDTIIFFREPKATSPDGNPIFSVDISVDAIQKWLPTDTALALGPASSASVGGLRGVRMDLEVAAGNVTHSGDCPVESCVSIFKGVDPSKVKTWQWDWSIATSDRQRLYLLTATDGVIAIFVDSLDGTTFDALTRAADTILPTVRFDKS